MILHASHMHAHWTARQQTTARHQIPTTCSVQMKERNATEVYFTLVILLHMTRLMPRHLAAFVDAPAPGGYSGRVHPTEKLMEVM